jgi:cytochrome P450
VQALRLASWVADRVKHFARRVAWQAARMRLQVRDATGLGGRLPPGSLGASCPAKAYADDRFYFAQLRRYGPIFKLFWGSGHLKVCVVGIPLGRRLLTQHRSAVRPTTVDIKALVPADYLRSMSPAVHPAYRRLFLAAFRDDLVAPRERELRDLITGELVRLADDIGRGAPRARRLYEALDAIALRALLMMVFGLRAGDASVARLADAYRRLGPDGHVAVVGPQQKEAFGAIRTIVAEILQETERDGAARLGDSVLRRLVASHAASIDETVIGNAIYMVERGHHDVRDLFRWLLKYLGEHPALVSELGGDGAGRTKLAEACVLETLRMDQAELLNRRAVDAVTFEGFHVPRGSWVAVLLRESHRDPHAFPDPDAFRPARFVERSYSADEYAPFGIDEHQCVAASLVVRMATLFVEELTKEFTWSVCDDGPRRHGHFHWEPSPTFAIDIRRRVRLSPV